MKRAKFQITSTAGHSVLKNAWNASIRETEKLIKEVALQESTVYELTDSSSEKSETGFSYIRGYRTWVGNNGNIVTFRIEKI